MNRTDDGWLGGSNYLTNLLASIDALPDRQIETLLLVPPGADANIGTRFPADKIIRTRLVLPRGRRRLAGMATQRLFGRNLAMEWLARIHRIDLFSHVPPTGARSPLKTLSWIPDFQHLRLPDFFGPDERALRDRGHAAISEQSTLIVLSSHDAAADLIRAWPNTGGKARVLQFVSGVGHAKAPRPPEELAVEYGLDGPFFHVPNQLWKHKNHRVVIEALGLLKREGLTPVVLCTGHTEDHRYPGFLDELKAYAAAQDVAQNFRILGLIPYPDVVGLMHFAAAIINPSLFEGWSTTVEESKSTGKRILLSDIPVHREQSPERGTFFAANDRAALAAAMKQVLADYDPLEDEAFARRAAEALPLRLRAFAEAYQAIALEAAGGR
jgi:glycosyltransferase involved in cell wall biosynthesis